MVKDASTRSMTTIVLLLLVLLRCSAIIMTESFSPSAMSPVVRGKTIGSGGVMIILYLLPFLAACQSSLFRCLSPIKFEDENLPETNCLCLQTMTVVLYNICLQEE